jgi:hypothetical protein
MAAALVLAVAVVGCGGGDSSEPSTQTDETVAATGEPSAFEAALELLPNEEAVHQQLVFGDLERLRAAYPTRAELNPALAGIWPADALAGATTRGWRKTFGFGLSAVDRFVAGGFHPVATAVLEGRFDPDRIRRALRGAGYRRVDGLLSRGEDGSIDEETATGRLALSSLNRVRVSRDRVIAASSTALAAATAQPASTVAEDADLVTVARALGPVTAALVLPADLVRPAAGALITPIADARPLRVGVGLDDQGPTARTVSIVLLYDTAELAESEAVALAGFGQTEVPTQNGETFGDALSGLTVTVVEERAVLIRGRVVAGQDPGLWRGWLESGDLAVLLALG